MIRAARDVSRLLGGEVAELRHLINEKRSFALDHLGLPAALEAMAARVLASGGPTVTTTVSLAGRLDHDTELGIYRIIQEALTNAVKHSHAAAVKVELVAGDQGLVASMADDGVGFDPTTPSPGLGLVGMRERAQLLGATLHICSSSLGTTIRLSRCPDQGIQSPQ